jgi:hypothetical protein
MSGACAGLVNRPRPRRKITGSKPLPAGLPGLDRNQTEGTEPDRACQAGSCDMEMIGDHHGFTSRGPSDPAITTSSALVDPPRAAPSCSARSPGELPRPCERFARHETYRGPSQRGSAFGASIHPRQAIRMPRRRIVLSGFLRRGTSQRDPRCPGPHLRGHPRGFRDADPSAAGPSRATCRTPDTWRYRALHAARPHEARLPARTRRAGWS